MKCDEVRKTLPLFLYGESYINVPLEETHQIVLVQRELEESLRRVNG